MTPERAPRDVGRWSESGHFWHCDGATQSADGCPCYWSHAAHIDHCENCGLVCPPLPETPAPRVEVRDDYGAKMWRQLEEMAQAVKQADADENAVVAWMWDALGVKLKSTDAQVVGKEPIAGVDEAGDNGKARAWLTVYATLEEVASDAMNAARGNGKSGVQVVCEVIRNLAALRAVPVEGGEPIAGVSEAMIDAAMRADGFGYAAISDTLPDLVAQTREWYRRILSAALRAVPVEGREPVAWEWRWRVTRTGQPSKWMKVPHRHEVDSFCAEPAIEVRALYAHPAPDGDA